MSAIQAAQKLSEGVVYGTTQSFLQNRQSHSNRWNVVPGQVQRAYQAALCISNHTFDFAIRPEKAGADISQACKYFVERPDDVVRSTASLRLVEIMDARHLSFEQQEPLLHELYAYLEGETEKFLSHQGLAGIDEILDGLDVLKLAVEQFYEGLEEPEIHAHLDTADRLLVKGRRILRGGEENVS